MDLYIVVYLACTDFAMVAAIFWADMRFDLSFCAIGVILTQELLLQQECGENKTKNLPKRKIPQILYLSPISSHSWLYHMCRGPERRSDVLIMIYYLIGKTGPD